ncbi:MAG: site-2 protease family protein [Gammaproteobacteria bacterium]|nr:site-2 protease family protein [Gammaproteobacteria bacterium]
MDKLSTAQLIAVWLIPVLFAITLHEVAHGWVASKFGDLTAKLLGRLSLNPLKHIDPIGTIALPALLIITHAGFVFGWAKPVPVNQFNLNNPRRDMAIVAVAGPLSNLLMAIMWAAGLKAGIYLAQTQSPIGQWLVYSSQAGIMINIWLMVLNLIPIPPLDGSRVIASLLTPKAAQLYGRIEPFGIIILIILVYTNVLTAVIAGPAEYVFSSILGLFRII